MPRVSAGLLLYRVSSTTDIEVLLVHPGGPFWARKDAGAWSIPKGEYDDGDDPAARAEVEFAEELGRARHRARASTSVRSVRRVASACRAWAVHGDIDALGHHEQHLRDGVAPSLW